jgi:hypothetical protein
MTFESWSASVIDAMAPRGGVSGDAARKTIPPVEQLYR